LNNDFSKLPLPIQARLLNPEQTIEDANIADNEVIVMEMMYTFDHDVKSKYIFGP
jgi:hypothetical protein